MPAAALKAARGSHERRPSLAGLGTGGLVCGVKADPDVMGDCGNVVSRVAVAVVLAKAMVGQRPEPCAQATEPKACRNLRRLFGCVPKILPSQQTAPWQSLVIKRRGTRCWPVSRARRAERSQRRWAADQRSAPIGAVTASTAASSVDAQVGTSWGQQRRGHQP